ncbi:MAG: 50S ribosomal protein L32 [Myxococcota bacterium]
MAVPRKRKSNSRRKQQRSHDALTAPNYTACPSCGEPKMPHRACMSCGTHNGKQIMQVEAE